MFFPEIDQASEDKWHSIAGKILPRVEDLFHTYHLVPGLYSITNNLRFLVENGEANLDMSGRSSKTVPQDEKIDVTFTQDHITLIRHMNTRIYENCVEIMDYKRPYGDCFYYYIDTAHALDEPILMNSEGKVAFPKDTEGRYYQLHTEMLFAIQAFWTYATLPKP
ncbi:hypothetical protein MKK88_17135 [Methylobacterium sp. E-005]|uniref:hypothetical protein n=1 Tax=Methylobacterium sp. E-005 TaxID=2836549 RepID=UPI001FBB28D6|nr:hypothetical protein [Methylobacterium sp. E-005]MCJ2087694.1 hypothetical protein [Methylobacterium sp. E-005]